MAEEEPKKEESEPMEVPEDIAEEKSEIPSSPPKKTLRSSKPLIVVEETRNALEDKSSEGNRDAILARIVSEKRLWLIKAWEESEKAKARNKAEKKLYSIGAWESSKKANTEAELKRIEKKLEKKKAECMERMKNKAALIHKVAEEKRAMAEAKREEYALEVEEMAAKYRATGSAPLKIFGYALKLKI